jgi:predicted naringenin-chalcone synthase
VIVRLWRDKLRELRSRLLTSCVPFKLAFMNARIVGLGTAVPHFSIEQDQSVAFAHSLLYKPGREARTLPVLYRMTSVQRRGSILLSVNGDGASNGNGKPDVIEQDFYPDADHSDQRGPSTKCRSDRYSVEAMPLAKRACREALADAGMAAESITHLVVVTCTGFYAPGIDVELIEELGFNRETERVQVGFMGCHGAINGLRVARGLIAADPAARVLMVCIELCSLHYQYGWDTDRVVSNAIFADGSAAVVLCASDQTDQPELVATGSRLVQDSKDAMTWRIGDHGFEMTLSAEVPGLIEAKLHRFITDWLAKHGLRIEDVGGWDVHPGGPRILLAVENALCLPKEALTHSRNVLADHGNMSSATMLFIMRRFMDQSVPGPWVMLGFGPGLEIEVALVQCQK